MKRRYRDIKQRMQQKVPRPAAAKHDDALGQVLDDLNAWGFLADQQQAHHERINCFGPGIFRGYLPITWAGVAIWYKPRGYYFYDTLSLIGIWTLRAAPTQVDVTLGVRQLRYALPFFNPESYYYRIQQEFRTAIQGRWLATDRGGTTLHDHLCPGAPPGDSARAGR
jgi:hypothetical protein